MNVAIIGGGGYAIELCSFIQDDKKSKLNIVGFFDDNKDCALFKSSPVIDYLGGIEDCFNADLPCIIAIGNPIIKAQVFKKISCYVELFTYIHSTAVVSSSAKIGNGVIIGPFSIISANAEISDNVCMNVFCGVGHGSKVNESTVLGPHTLINGDCFVGNACYLGSKSAVFPRTIIGDGVSIGAGMIVRRNLEDFTLYSQKVEELSLPNRIVKKEYKLIYE